MNNYNQSEVIMRNVKPVKVGDCVLDGKHIYIQSMLNMRSDDIEGSVRQAVELEKAGCEIVRCGRLADSAFLIGDSRNDRIHVHFCILLIRTEVLRLCNGRYSRRFHVRFASYRLRSGSPRP